MYEQLTLFPPLPSPVRTVYGEGVGQAPALLGRKDSAHMEAIYLDSLLPLEDYDKIIVLFSGGKDSLACVLDLMERGVPREKIELWHHDIDGGHPTRKMDWPVTQNYVRAVAEYLGITLRVGRDTELSQHKTITNKIQGNVWSMLLALLPRWEMICNTITALRSRSSILRTSSTGPSLFTT